ncbi:hypothetical protein SADUNF_Sadunf15G0092300 [Salix dunnii]|uniref:Uncharacterized protein n=1 Tax=Salix dunnii TaxID=1413687 RepID=A0A835JGJ7_9ROSI|nr:hypothetical protein SADUNF_Sadunf15G0092300 [Salix dunnii]
MANTRPCKNKVQDKVAIVTEGVMSFGKQTVLDFDLDSHDKLFAINVRGVAACLKHAARVMVEGGVKGSIICTASTIASVVRDMHRDYIMSKCGVITLMKCASYQLSGHGIRVNCVIPGPVATPLSCKTIGMGVEEAEKAFKPHYCLEGVLKAKHVANAVVFLASADSEFVTDHNLVVDGGYHFQAYYTKRQFIPPEMANAKKVQDKVAIVTRGASGIGEATVLAFAENGARGVVITDIQDEKGQKLAESIGTNRYHKLCLANCSGLRPGLVRQTVRSKHSWCSGMPETRDAYNGGRRCKGKHHLHGKHRWPVETPMVCEANNMGVEEVEKLYESSYCLKGVFKAKHIVDAVLFLASADSKFVIGKNLVVDGGYTFQGAIK